MTTAGPDADILTLEYKINFLRPAVGPLITAEARVLRAGRSIIVTRIDVLDSEGRLRAALQQSMVPATAPAS